MIWLAALPADSRYFFGSRSQDDGTGSEPEYTVLQDRKSSAGIDHRGRPLDNFFFRKGVAMQTAKQLSVSLVNKPGRLADMLAALAKEKMNFQALCVMDSGGRGTVRFVPDNVDAAIAVLDQMNVRYEINDVLLADLPNQPGGFRHVCERLAMEHLNIDYAYCSFNDSGKAKGVSAVIKVNDLAKAQRIIGVAVNGRKKRLPMRRPMKVAVG
jgi:hypothetical protein